MSNNNHIIEQIISQADIVKIIGKHTELKRSGNEFKGNCPFHGEKSPSFFVNPQKGLYKCFGCGVGGNALTFLKEYENLTAGEALQELSRQTGIELPKERYNAALSYKRQVTPAAKNPPPQTNVPHPAPANVNQSNPSDTLNTPNLPLDNPPVLPQAYFDTGIDFDTAMAELQANTAIPFDFYQTSPIENYHAPSLNLTSQNSPTDGQAPFYPASDYPAANNFPTDNQASDSGNLYDLLTQIGQFYQHQLYQNPQALQYFYRRGLTEATIAEFGLGYAPTGWQHLEQAFPKDIEGLKVLGLVRQSQKGRDFDLLRHRVIFAIRDGRGRVIGFAGRALLDTDMPKYINSSDSPVFHKNQVLYGMYEARKVKAERFLVVEGYMDVISLHQAGVYGAVAAMGTALATSQIEKLLQYHPVLTLSFDGDAAGQKAAWRALETALPALYDGKELRFLSLPQEHDPDSFVKSQGAAAMQAQIDNAMPLSEYVFSTLSRRIPIHTAEGRSKLLAELNLLTQKLPTKGSYAWLLREDIRSRMGLGKRQQARATQDALLNFHVELTLLLQLQLCFLFQPSVLGAMQNGQINRQIIDTIFGLSGADNIKFSKKNPLPPPHLATLQWQDIVDEPTLNLIGLIQRSQSSLQDFSQQMSRSSAYEIVNAKAHFLLVGMAAEKRTNLAEHWGRFLRELAERDILDVSDLVMEIVVKLVLDGLQTRLIQQKDIESKQYVRNQIQAIFNWQKIWLEKQES